MLLFSIKSLIATKSKALIAIAGVVFSFVLVNLQCGMFLGMVSKTVTLLDESSADIWIGHRGIENVDVAALVPSDWLDRIRGVDGVESAEELIVAPAYATLSNGGFEGVIVVGSRGKIGPPTSLPSTERSKLGREGHVTIDRSDRPRLGMLNVGDHFEIDGKRATVAAETDGVLGFITTPYVFTSLENARRFTNTPHDRCHFILVKSNDGKREAILKNLKRRLPDADVFTDADLAVQSKLYWTLRTGLGASFGGATILGVLVGFLMVAQTFYAMVLDHMEDFATLKAIGASNGVLTQVLLTQSFTAGGTGVLIGMLVVICIRNFASTPTLTIELNGAVLAGSVILITLICLISITIPLRKACLADPLVTLR